MTTTNRNAAAEARGVPETDQLGGKVSWENSLATRPIQGQRGGRRSGAEAERVEREIVSRHDAIGIKSERYRLDGGTRFRGSSHDMDICAFGTDEGPLVAEVKSRQSAAGFLRLEKCLSECRLFFAGTARIRWCCSGRHC